jgi:hypothetical protein
VYEGAGIGAVAEEAKAGFVQTFYFTLTDTLFEVVMACSGSG